MCSFVVVKMGSVIGFLVYLCWDSYDFVVLIFEWVVGYGKIVCGMEEVCVVFLL